MVVEKAEVVAILAAEVVAILAAEVVEEVIPAALVLLRQQQEKPQRRRLRKKTQLHLPLQQQRINNNHPVLMVHRLMRTVNVLPHHQSRIQLLQPLQANKQLPVHHLILLLVLVLLQQLQNKIQLHRLLLTKPVLVAQRQIL
jgi:hypothetical protein